MVDTMDLKSIGLSTGHAGSSPALGTNKYLFLALFLC